MTDYNRILAVQSPSMIGFDDANRVMWSVNFVAEAKSPVTNFAREITKILSDAGIGTYNTDIFISLRRTLPIGDGPYMTLIQTGSTPPDETQDGVKFEHLGLQVVVRGTAYEDTNTKVNAVFAELDGTRDVTVTV